MNFDFIVEALENFANWGGVFSDIFTAFGDIFGDDGLPALSSALEPETVTPETPEAPEGGDDTGNGDTGNGDTGQEQASEGAASGE